MAEGPAGIERPFVETNLKYDVEVEVDRGIFTNPPKAKELLDMRVNAPQQNSNKFLRESIGDVLLAVNRLAHPSRAKVVSTEAKENETGNVARSGKILIVWTYILQGAGLGEFANKATTSKAMKDAHTVLIEENSSPIKRAKAIREFNPSPYSVERVRISTD